MSVTVLHDNEVLNPGVKLWVLPAPNFSDWTQQLDWPLNLQIFKAAQRTTRKPAPELTMILQKHQLQFDLENPEEKNLMIATQGLLPTEMVVVVPAETWEQWQSSALQLWRNLGKPTARFFLPAFAKWDEVKNSWPASANIESVQIVSLEGAI